MSSPYSIWFGHQPRLDHLRIFGSEVVYYLEKKWRKSKLGSTGCKGVMLGYVEGHRNYRIWSMSEQKVMFTHNLVFKEDTLPSLTLTTKQATPQTTFELPDFYPVTTSSVENSEHVESSVADNSSEGRLDSNPSNPSSAGDHFEEAENEEEASIEDSFAQDSLVPDSNVVPESSKKGYQYVPHFSVAPRDISSALSEENIISTRFRSARGNHIVMEPAPSDPTTYQAATSSKDAEEWIAAIDNELGNMERQNVWSITLLTPGAKPISCKWVFKRKYDENGLIEKFKARLVVRGFLQKEGIDYNQTFSPTGRLATLRAVLSIAANLDLQIHQMDVKCAFLNGKPDCDVFIRPPEGVTVKLKPGEGLKLNKSLYGLKQSP